MSVCVDRTAKTLHHMVECEQVRFAPLFEAALPTIVQAASGNRSTPESHT